MIGTHTLYNIVSTEIYTPHAGADEMLLQINGKLQMEKLKSSLCRKASLLTDPHCRFIGVGQCMTQT